ncbi:MAG: PD-(D/E)XK nuclease family protein, partial [Clostridia bacterium]|nr:PD-(D/E)XK nuclease family protein [Clostridia bacterium]
NIMHYIFENILKNDMNSYIGNKDKLRTDIDAVVNEYAVQNLGGLDKLSPQDKYRFARLVKSAETLLVRLIDELTASKFKPMAFELSLSQDSEFKPLEITAEDGRKISVGGKIDRVDSYTSEDGTEYIRVVDYKTGTKEFRLQDVLYGLNLQMLVYLCAMTDDGKYLPAGVLYMPSAVPYISASKNDSEADIEKERNKKQVMNGLVLDSLDIAAAMEENLEGKYIPAKMNRGKTALTGSIANKLEFELIFSHIRKLITGMADSIINGRIMPKPHLNKSNSCNICPYTAVCLSAKDDNSIDKTSLNNSQALEIMKEGESNADMD